MKNLKIKHITGSYLYDDEYPMIDDIEYILYTQCKAKGKSLPYEFTKNDLPDNINSGKLLSILNTMQSQQIIEINAESFKLLKTYINES